MPPSRDPDTNRSSRPVFRFAPSPNGFLHLGHALSALITYRLAQELGGRFLLRIEDIDRGRTRREFIDAIFEDLTWLGIEWEEPVLFQSERFAAYEAAAQSLQPYGVTYACAATRAEIAAACDPARADPDGAPLYKPVCQWPTTQSAPSCNVREGPKALRLDTVRACETLSAPLTYLDWDGAKGTEERIADPAIWGHPVIVRKDTPASYHLAVVVDDAFQGVTHVTRGADLEASTDLHVLLQRLLGLSTPVYHHHRLLTDHSGRKLSKSARDTSLGALRREGLSATALRARLGV